MVNQRGYRGRMANTQADKDARIVLEGELLLLAPDTSREDLETWLHPDFTEVIRDGRRFTRSEVISLLTAPGYVRMPRTVVDVKQDRVTDSAILVTYISEEGDVRRRHATLWLRVGSDWRAYYHQATAIQPAITITPLSSLVVRRRSRSAMPRGRLRHPRGRWP
jgi:hypothetical protein